MKPFTTLKGRAAPLPISNVDTDMIIPKQFLKTIKRTGLGKNLFDEMRHDDSGNERPEFVLNKPAYRKAQILVAGENFGCGSSREHAPWAILDFGIRCIIAPSYADIFYNNCFKNGILPIVLKQTEVNELMKEAEFEENEFLINLENQTVAFINPHPEVPGSNKFSPGTSCPLPVNQGEGGVRAEHNLNSTINHEPSTIDYQFDIDPFRKYCLINGLDDIGLTMEKTANIKAYEEKMAKVNPWLWN